MFVIYKNSRIPEDVSYSGPAWDAAQIRHLRKDVYEDELEAVALCPLLSYVNPIGFSVAKKEDHA